MFLDLSLTQGFFWVKILWLPLWYVSYREEIALSYTVYDYAVKVVREALGRSLKLRYIDLRAESLFDPAVIRTSEMMPKAVIVRARALKVNQDSVLHEKRIKKNAYEIGMWLEQFGPTNGLVPVISRSIKSELEFQLALSCEAVTTAS